MASLAPPYVPRRPTESALYTTVRRHLESFKRWTRETYERPLPRYVEEELEGYLRCGVFAHGFVRCRCDACGHELLVAFSCKGRGLCPSCAGRRMASTAAHLVDRVLPDVPVRQYVLTLPLELRARAAYRADVLTAIARAFVAAIFARQRRVARGLGIEGSECGAVTFVQRFGGSLNLNVHLHVVVLDGVFTREQRAPDGMASFHATPAPTRADLEGVARAVERRIESWLRRRSLRDDTSGEDADAGASEDALVACAAIAMQRGEQMTLPVDGDATDERSGRDAEANPSALRARGSRSPLVAERSGFNVEAAVRIEAGDDEGRERLCRYGARPAVSLARLRLLPGGRVAYRIKRAGWGRAKHRVMTGLELCARLAALVPPPRYPLVRYHGVLAPRSSWRRAVVPRPREPVDPAVCAPGARASEVGRTKRDPSLSSSPERASPSCRNEPTSHARVVTNSAVASTPTSTASSLPRVERLLPNVLSVSHWQRLLGGALYAATVRIDWATLLRRTFAVDVLECAACHGRLRVLGAVNDARQARALLERLNLPTEAPPRARARDPSDEDDETPAPVTADDE